MLYFTLYFTLGNFGDQPSVKILSYIICQYSKSPLISSCSLKSAWQINYHYNDINNIFWVQRLMLQASCTNNIHVISSAELMQYQQVPLKPEFPLFSHLPLHPPVWSWTNCSCQFYSHFKITRQLWCVVATHWSQVQQENPLHTFTEQ